MSAMTDLPETVAELRRLLAEYLEARAAYRKKSRSWVRQNRHEITAGTLLDTVTEALPALLDAADLPLLLARVVERWGPADYNLTFKRRDDSPEWVATALFDNGRELVTEAEAYGPTLDAALRALLGEEVSGG